MTKCFLTIVGYCTLMRKVLNHFAPRSLSGFIWKSAFFCVLIFGWHVLVTRQILRDADHTMTDMALESLFIGTPFVFLFMLGSWQQVSAIRALTKRAYYDPLSKVFNRQTFIGRLKRALPKSRTGLLLLMDVDHFKRINDQYGHAAGDRCIEAIGHRLNWHLRLEDLAGRIGGEEFAVFLADVSEEHGKTVAVRLGQPVSFTDPSAKEHLTVTLSVGAVWAQSDVSFEKQLVAADDALYVAKSLGRAQLRFADGSEAIALSSQSELTSEDYAGVERRTNSKIELAARQ
ncbi:MAG: GGDEF domain-containing protein [Boseongicola sp.]|nr:GGDEF domain-containing protein [Boseongicola sp.]NNL18709.1 GGDEF domain-containing protein [Boseongicola sp.]